MCTGEVLTRLGNSSKPSSPGDTTVRAQHAYVRLASLGETVLIADRDRVVAELVRPRPGRADTASDAVLASLVREARSRATTGACGRA